MQRPPPEDFLLKETNPHLGGGKISGDKLTSTYDLVEQMQYLYVRVQKAKDLPGKDVTGSCDPYVEVKMGNYKGTTRHFEKKTNPEWNQVFAFSKDRIQASVLEVTVKDKDVVKDDFIGRVLFDLNEIPKRVPPDSPLAPQWYRLEDRKSDKAKGELMLAVWMGTQADEAFPEAWHSDAATVSGADALSNIRSKVYLSPKLWYLRVNVIEAQDLQPTDKGRYPEVFVKAILGNQAMRTRVSQSRSINPIWNEDLMFVAAEPFEEHVSLVSLSLSQFQSPNQVSLSCIRFSKVLVMKKGMANSDDNDEPQALCLSNYHLDDDNDMPLSFITIPMKWSESDEDDSVDDCKQKKVFIHGYVHPNRLKKMFAVKAWIFNLSSLKPIISLQTKDGNWIKLKSPRKSFEATIRTILITIHFLHYAKKNPKLSSSRSVWDNLSKVKELSSYKLKPSLSDLLNHMHLISEAAKRDDVLAKSKLVLTILEENPGNQKLSDEKGCDIMDEANEESEPEDDVCALCDNGGNLVCCDGACKRSFHATVEHGRESMCDSLGLTKKEVDKKTFYCKNCEHKQHQCFACGKLGYSGLAKGAEVIQCDSPTCYHFYHPHCVAKLLPQVVKHDVEELGRNIADENHFTCPIHYCSVCKEGENKKDPELQFAVCRRCPKSYHRKCLPREISFDNEEDEDIVPRAWEGLLSNNRILLYCMNHEINDELGTPIRDHIKFPNFKVIAREINTSKEKTKHPTTDRVISNKKNVDLDNSSDKSTAKGSNVTGKLSSRKAKSKETSRRCSFENKRSSTEKYKTPNSEENQPLCAPINKDLMCINPDIQGSLLDIDSERRLLALVEEVKSEVTLDSVKRQLASDYTPCSLRKAEKAIINEKLEGSVNTDQTDLRKLDGRCNIQDVQAVCNPDGLLKIVDTLHWYARIGDTIVDFCHGANDFSILMKKKLDESGKECSYKNYDMLPTKNDLSFERRDWMTVRPNELPTGEQLIVCLRPPFGTKTALANNIIDKALEFAPKLVILIIPQDAERLDKKLQSYDLVWENENFQSCLPFYEPGSVVVNDKQVGQWNAKTHVLSFWSRRDWTTKHKVIAQEHGHISSRQEVLETDTEMLLADCDRDGNNADNDLPSYDQASIDECKKMSSHNGNVDQESKEEPECMKSKSGKISRKRKHIEENDSLPAKRQAVNGMTADVPNHSQPNPNNTRSSAEGSQPEPVIACPNVEVSDNTRIKEGSSVVSALSGCSGTRKREHDSRGEEEKQQTESDEREPGSASKPSYKLNHVEMMGSEPPIVIRSCTCEGSVHQPGYGARQLSFASGPNLEYSLRHSVGWLDE